MKEGFGPPDGYLEVNVNKFQPEDEKNVWSITCFEYLHRAINNIYSILEGNKAALKSLGNVHCPNASSYRTELDVNDKFNEDLTNIFQQIIGVLRW